MAPRHVVRGFEDVQKLLKVGVVCAKLAIGLAKLVGSKGCRVLLIWVAEVAIEGCKEDSEAFKADLESFCTAVVCGFEEVDPHR